MAGRPQRNFGIRVYYGEVFPLRGLYAPGYRGLRRARPVRLPLYAGVWDDTLWRKPADSSAAKLTAPSRCDAGQALRAVDHREAGCRSK
jgi:hypothetical protein